MDAITTAPTRRYLDPTVTVGVHEPSDALVRRPTETLTSALGNGYHAPVLDIGHRVTYAPATDTTPALLRVHHEISPTQYARLISTLAETGLVEAVWVAETITALDSSAPRVPVVSLALRGPATVHLADKGHSHVLIEQAIPWEDYETSLRALASAGICTRRWVWVSRACRFSRARVASQ